MKKKLNLIVEDVLKVCTSGNTIQCQGSAKLAILRNN